VMIIKRGFPAYGLNECLAEYRKVQGSISHNKVKAIRRQWDNYRKVLGIPLLPCLYYYTLFALNSIKKHYFS
jgi:teichuronic acid biosynthesis glycosyltransferase TuaG